MNPTVLLIRHGETSLNDPKNEKLRGYSDIPLSVDGERNVKLASQWLADQKLPITKILSSPLQRAIMTASIIAEPYQAKVTPCNGLLPWNLGKLTGQPIKTAAKQLDYYQEYPDLKIPEGESYRKFYERWADALDNMLEWTEKNLDMPLVGTVHSRNLLALPSILGDRNIGDVPVKGGPPPQSITKIEQVNGEWKMSLLWKVENT